MVLTEDTFIQKKTNLLDNYLHSYKPKDDKNDSVY